MTQRPDFYADGGSSTYVAQDDQDFSISEIGWQHNDDAPSFFGHVLTEEEYPGLRVGPAEIRSRHGASFSTMETIEVTRAAGSYAQFVDRSE